MLDPKKTLVLICPKLSQVVPNLTRNMGLGHQKDRLGQNGTKRDKTGQPETADPLCSNGSECLGHQDSAIFTRENERTSDELHRLKETAFKAWE